MEGEQALNHQGYLLAYPRYRVENGESRRKCKAVRNCNNNAAMYIQQPSPDVWLYHFKMNTQLKFN